MNLSRFRIADKSEKANVKGYRMEYAQEYDWVSILQDKGAMKVVPVKGGRGRGKGKEGLKRIRRVLRDCLHSIPKAAICRLARRGGVKRMSGLIYDECRGVLKVFLQEVLKDTLQYTECSGRRTVTPVDVIYALKRHGRNVYGFGRPYSYHP